MINSALKRFVNYLKSANKIMAESTGMENENLLKRVLQNDSEENGECKKVKMEECEDNSTASVKKVKRKKIALLIAYSGEGYYGVQIQKEYPTIEGELFKSLVLNEYITKEEAESPQKIQFQRASRTDKGVSAVGNIFSVMLGLDPDMISKMNEHLPEQIKVINYLRVTKGFNSKNYCDSRTYMYMMPTYAFVPVDQTITDSYRINDQTLNRLKEVLNRYKGTHNFHNYTSGVKPTEKSAFRYIRSFGVEDLVVEDGIEYITLKVHGQSFMLHQIRKMIGLAISIVRNSCSQDVLEKSFHHDLLDVPKAPGLGLYLYQVHFDGYNKRYGTDGIHDTIDWSEHHGELEEFRKTHIVSNITKCEKEDQVVLKWLECLKLHTFSDRDAIEKEDSSNGPDTEEIKLKIKETSETEVVSGKG